MRTVVQVEDLSKRYQLGVLGASTFTEGARRWIRGLFRKTNPAEGSERDLWALEDINFSVGRGEVFGIIGANGAGKSTLLKILSRITAPTSGCVRLRGRTGTLLEVGTGFHQELTGRENVYLNGAVLGMKRREIAAKFDEIVEFAGVARFIDTPVKRYSSGMKVRLGFAVAAHLDPEILIIDEVLAVGDVAFQKKCIGKMNEVAGQGRTVLFVSHNMAAVSNLCQRTMLLQGGRVKLIDDTEVAVAEYLREGVRESDAVPLSDRKDRRGDGTMRFTSFRAVDPESGRAVDTAIAGKDLVLELGYELEGGESLDTRNIIASIQIFSSDGRLMTMLENVVTGDVFPTLDEEGYLYCRISRLPLTPGRYRIDLALHLNMGHRVFDYVSGAATLEIVDGDFFGTGRTNSFGNQGVYVHHRWGLSMDELHG